MKSVFTPLVKIEKIHHGVYRESSLRQPLLEIGEFESQRLIVIGRVSIDSPETCNPVGYPTFGYSWVKHFKSSKPIGVMFEI